MTVVYKTEFKTLEFKSFLSWIWMNCRRRGLNFKKIPCKWRNFPSWERTGNVI